MVPVLCTAPGIGLPGRLQPGLRRPSARTIPTLGPDCGALACPDRPQTRSAADRRAKFAGDVPGAECRSNSHFTRPGRPPACLHRQGRKLAMLATEGTIHRNTAQISFTSVASARPIRHAPDRQEGCLGDFEFVRLVQAPHDAFSYTRKPAVQASPSRSAACWTIRLRHRESQRETPLPRRTCKDRNEIQSFPQIGFWGCRGLRREGRGGRHRTRRQPLAGTHA